MVCTNAQKYFLKLLYPSGEKGQMERFNGTSSITELSLLEVKKLQTKWERFFLPHQSASSNGMQIATQSLRSCFES